MSTAGEAETGRVPSYVIDIVIPVYNAADDVRTCVESVLTHLRPDVRVVLIDDASSDPRIATYFAKLEEEVHPQLVVLRNEHNLGFTGTANRGMSLSRAEVILLNSDTIVTAGWLDALMHCAATDACIGTITPFSNNAEICSFPRFCDDNPWLLTDDPELTARAISAAAVPLYPDLPTGVGFCMFVRRALIDDIGTFDMAFGAGYGEENDFCLRAAEAGWRNVLADNAFVVHTGGKSFVGRKSELGTRNMALLLERHPHYLTMVRAFIAEDSLRPLRQAAAARLAVMERPGRGALHVIHHHGGGTETHVRALIASSPDGWRHYLAIAVGDAWQVEEHQADGEVVTFDFVHATDESWPEFVGGVCATFGIDVIHLHNISACREGILQALENAPVPYGYTVHDLNFACPTITFLGVDGMYCGAQTTAATCTQCLRDQGGYGDVRIVDWRARHHALLQRAAFRVAPSTWTAKTLLRYFPDAPATVIAHGAPGESPAAEAGLRTLVMMPNDGVPTIAMLGAIGPDKGARRIERLVSLARDRGARLRFVVIGYLDVEHGPWQSGDAMLTVHGRYRACDLPAILEHYRIALVLYPSAGPETFSYTLSEAWAAGRPVLVPPIGALEERVRLSAAGWVMAEEEWRDEGRMLDRVLALVDPGHATALAAASARARARPHATLQHMAKTTFALYEQAVEKTTASLQLPFVSARVLHALHYRPWQPPPPRLIRSLQPRPGFLGRLARAAADRRHGLPGRVLFRLAPKPLLAALRSRLK